MMNNVTHTYTVTNDDTHTISHPSRTSQEHSVLSVEGEPGDFQSDDLKPTDNSAKFTHITQGKVSKIKTCKTRSRKSKIKSVVTPSQDIRIFFTASNSKCIPSDLEEVEGELGVVSDEIEHGHERITHSAYTDRGPILFSLDQFEDYLDMGPDKLREITTSYWNIYKGGVISSSPIVLIVI